ncbi:hypothetical protein AB0K15_47145 [Amycolatopsis sp. NPDC049253]|uniref:hypothetical protein n=1 Tax=Amycolatopsis sp. NPDC049253 TaxID=3155274 RepID=UPI00342E41A7
MTARLIFQPDAAAHSAKNALAAPGSTIQPQDRTEEPQMVDTTTVARDVADQTTAVTYTPRELNVLISREIAGRLCEIADTLTTNAGFLLANDDVPVSIKRPRAGVYRDVALQLIKLAGDELHSAWAGEVR